MSLKLISTQHQSLKRYIFIPYIGCVFSPLLLLPPPALLPLSLTRCSLCCFDTKASIEVRQWCQHTWCMRMWDGFHGDHNLGSMDRNFLKAGNGSPQVFLKRSLLCSITVNFGRRQLSAVTFGGRRLILIQYRVRWGWGLFAMCKAVCLFNFL